MWTMKLRLKIGIVGATGAVGQTAIDILENESAFFEIEALRLFASRSSVGKRQSFRKGGLDVSLEVEDTTLESLLSCDVVMFATDSFVALKFVPELAKAGVLCIDKSSAYREDPLVPLVVPEVNAHALLESSLMDFPVVANPNCCATPLAVALGPLHKAFGLKRVIVSTYQSVSGTGKPGMEVLREESKSFFSLQDLSPTPSQVYPKAIAFNVIPFVASLSKEGHTEEETKIILETRKILGLPSLPMGVTSVRVPTFVGHAESVTIEFSSTEFTVAKAKSILSDSPGICLVDEWTKATDDDDELGDVLSYPTPRDVQGKDPVYVGRVRHADVFDFGLSLWICADNLRKGAALNSIQILESFCKQGLMAVLLKKRSP
jgi:aspartate-semialdehyde dehydrogenase